MMFLLAANRTNIDGLHPRKRNSTRGKNDPSPLTQMIDANLEACHDMDRSPWLEFPSVRIHRLYSGDKWKYPQNTPSAHSPLGWTANHSQ